MYESQFDGIRFIEGRPANATAIGPIEISIGGIIASSQLRSLDDVKRMMADRVRNSAGNAVIDFTYGQKSVGFLASLFQRDDVNWYGKGTIAKV